MEVAVAQLVEQPFPSEDDQSSNGAFTKAHLFDDNCVFR